MDRIRRSDGCAGHGYDYSPGIGPPAMFVIVSEAVMAHVRNGLDYAIALSSHVGSFIYSYTVLLLTPYFK